ncbi:putative epoxide hydrolase [Favolaschia claudopus]|uniref:Epoxide hydrolase n=1 Tax=Favolaschia claudopus TaxID=2862362 RepID=A0AAW0EHE9_9AGAR
MVQLSSIALLAAMAFEFKSVLAKPAVNPFRVDLSAKISHLELLVKNTDLPSKPLYPGAGPEFGLQLDLLRDLKTEWVEGYNWTQQEAELNQLSQYTTVIGDQTVHFVHEKSQHKDAIPLLLLHGWPGSFHEFLPVIKPLTELHNISNGKAVSFDVVVPSLPGFLFSSPLPLNSSDADTAELFNRLMVDVLGYPKYALHGTDWGSEVGYRLYESFNSSVRAAHFVFAPFTPPFPQDIADNNITLSDSQKVTLQRSVDWLTIDQGYFQSQEFKPNDIGLALYDSPVGQLAWIGSLFNRWSDPRAGTGPSVLTKTAILTGVSLYYLTGSFQSSVWQYAHNANAFREYSKPPTDAPMLWSSFEYNIGLWPREYVAQIGNLVEYKEHDFGGHFPGLDNPPALIEDLRDIGLYFEF